MSDDYNNYYEIKCACGSKHCGSLIYFQPDTVEGDRQIMIGVDTLRDSASMWLTFDQARKLADDLLALVSQLKSEKAKVT